MARSTPARPFSPDAGAGIALGACLLGWVAVIVYTTLYPWSNWRTPTVAPLAFLLDGWPRYWTWQDVGLNFAGYLPVGLLAAALIGRGRPRAAAMIAATASGAALSGALETLQNFLPGRIPALSDVIANTAGAAIGAALAGIAGAWLARRKPPVQPVRTSLDGGALTGNLMLLAWLAAQAHPQPISFATGEIGPLLATLWPQGAGLLERLRPSTEQAPLFEAVAVATTVFGVGLLAREALRGPPLLTIAAPIVAAAAAESLASASLLGNRHALAWLNASTQGGLIAGTLALALAVWWPPRLRLLAAAMALLLSIVLHNLAPPNVYFQSSVAVWNQGHWENLNGLLRAVATLWPFVALGWCLLRLRRHRPQPIIRQR